MFRVKCGSKNYLRNYLRPPLISFQFLVQETEVRTLHKSFSLQSGVVSFNNKMLPKYIMYFILRLYIYITTLLNDSKIVFNLNIYCY